MRYFAAEQLRQTMRKISNGEGICVDIQVTINVFLIQLSSQLFIDFPLLFCFCIIRHHLRSARVQKASKKKNKSKMISAI